MKAAPIRHHERSFIKTRRLFIEPLEDRQLLDAGAAGEITAAPAAEDAPWYNPVYHLDVNNNGSTTAFDAAVIINRILDLGIGPLPDPGPDPPEFYYDTNGDNRLTGFDLLNVINGLLNPPKVTISTLATFTTDLSPQVTITGTDEGGLPDGTRVELDVDMNDDGDFDDDGELSHTQSTFFAGSSTFDLLPALERTDQPRKVRLRARTRDADGVSASSDILPLGVDTRTSTALEDYVNEFDDSYEWDVVSSEDSDGYTYYVLSMTSQTWRSLADVDVPEWNHWMGVYVPDGAVGDNAVMYIGGGHNTDPPPGNVSDEIREGLATIAVASGHVVFELTNVPNERVTFTDESFSRSEDEIIAYTFDKFLENQGEPGNETWPLLLPMTKSAVRAMDTIQEFIPTIQPNASIDTFVVTGGSKRGWTTWLTAAVDDRVSAIMPMVIDVLNMGPQMVHHYGAYGFFSPAIEDYKNLDIFERLLTDEGRELGRIVDPYSYLTNGRFDDMPKLLLNSAGDEFFVSDSSQYYFNDIPGNKNYLRYIPNTGHGLDERALDSLASFYGATLGFPLPNYSWIVDQNDEIHVGTLSNPSQVLLWQATNPTSRDFRNGYNPGIVWTSSPLVDQGGGNYVGDVPMPESGATAYFVELTFPFPFPGVPAYVFTTQINVKTELPLTDWPFDPGTPLPGGTSPLPLEVVETAAAPAVATDVAGRNATVSALALASVVAESPVVSSPIGLLSPAADETQPAAIDTTTHHLMLPAGSLSQATAAAETEAELADSIFGSSLTDLFD